MKKSKIQRTATVVSESLPVDLALLVAQVEEAGITGCEREFRFHPERQWRFDLAWPVFKVAFERDGLGGSHPQGIGRHQTADGMAGDNEKLNEAQIMGWIVVRGTRRTLADGSAAFQLVRALRERIR